MMYQERMRKAVEECLKSKEYNRSAWSRGVNEYAMELLDNIQASCDEWMPKSRTARTIEMLNGAEDWAQYSWGGCSLIYDSDIAERLCNPTELKRTRNGERKPNASEEWLDTQARALSQASSRLNRVIDYIMAH